MTLNPSLPAMSSILAPISLNFAPGLQSAMLSFKQRSVVSTSFTEPLSSQALRPPTKKVRLVSPWTPPLKTETSRLTMSPFCRGRESGIPGLKLFVAWSCREQRLAINRERIRCCASQTSGTREVESVLLLASPGTRNAATGTGNAFTCRAAAPSGTAHKTQDVGRQTSVTQVEETHRDKQPR